MRLIALPLLALYAALAAAWPQWSNRGLFVGPTVRVYVYVSEAFDADARAAIVDAEGAWVAAVGPRLQWVEVPMCSPGVVCVDPVPSADFYASIGVGKGTVGLTMRDPKAPTYVTLDVAALRAFADGGRDALRACAAHELGHAMLLPHGPHGSVMAASLDVGAQWPTAVDAAAWYARHRKL